DTLLNLMGFTDVEYSPSQPTSVTSAEPASIPGTILSQAAEAYGRPISYLFLHQEFTDGSWVEIDKNLLQQTLNAQMLQTGMAYYLGYTSTPLAHRQQLIEIANEARSAHKGVWQEDMTSDFVLNGQSDIGTTGQLIYPKLFRRATDYLKAVDKGFSGNLEDWILSVSQLPSRNENDAVVLHNTTEVHLSDLLEQRNSHVIFQADLLDITFVEK
ncbi:MAG TPA: thermonuclease family protein, partial [Ktedonobacteraceae bacterium]